MTTTSPPGTQQVVAVDSDAPTTAATLEQSGLDRPSAVDLYRTMVRIRAFETATEKLFLASDIPGFVHLSIGQEAIAAGVCGVLGSEDYITSTHRGHGHTLAKGAPTDRMMAELFGREEGICHGRGGSMHIADFSVGMLGANGIVAGGLGLAAGAGLSSKLTGSDRVAVSFFGDGATARGPFHEALNLAQVWQLPVVFVCENNGWASTTRSEEALAVSSVSERAGAYAMRSVAVDGNDVFAVRAAARAAVDCARSGDGPTLLEARTYRMRGHYVGDPTKYRDPDELARWEQQDPLARAGKALLEAGWVSEDERQSIHDRADQEIASAVEFARGGTAPDPAHLARYVYTD
jgi:pyruvate dehydrogenase E1 component alpha subunit